MMIHCSIKFRGVGTDNRRRSTQVHRLHGQADPPSSSQYAPGGSTHPQPGVFSEPFSKQARKAATSWAPAGLDLPSVGLPIVFSASETTQSNRYFSQRIGEYIPGLDAMLIVFGWTVVEQHRPTPTRHHWIRIDSGIAQQDGMRTFQRARMARGT